MFIQWNQIAFKPYKAITFSSYDRNGNLIYHTDCLMTLLNDHAVICLEAIKSKKERQHVILELTSSSITERPYQLIEIDWGEVEGMCANMFNLVDQDGCNLLVMSDRARRSFTLRHLKELESNYKIIATNIDTIEHIGGGSARCMLAEKF